MVRVFIANVRDLPDASKNPEVMAGLPAERKEKIMRIRREHERRQSLGAGLLLKHVQNLLGEKLCYNLSHSGDYVVCAVSDKPVGCDIEKIKEAPLKVAKRYFCESEVNYLDGAEDKNLEFFRLWTIKESYVKMYGKGLSMGLKNFEVNLEKEVSIIKNGTKEECHIREYELEEYRISVCAEEEFFEDKLGIIEL